MISNSIYWNIDPEIVNIFGVSLRYYGVLFVAGLILSIAFLKRIFQREGIDPLKLDKLTVYGVVGIFVGARLGHCLFYEPGYYLDHPLEMLLPIQAKPGGGYTFSGYQGLASHGGAVGLLIALIIYSKRTAEPMLLTIDLIGIVGPVTGCFIRLANLMNSEIIGKPSDVPWAFIFARHDNIPRHPAQLYEAIAYLISFGILWNLYNAKKVHPGHGFYFGLSMLLAFLSRFVIEFVKERQVAFEEDMALDMGQWLSIPFILAGIAFTAYGLMKERNNRPPTII